MTLSRLILKEILYRKLNLALALLSVTVAVGTLVAQVSALRAHDARTDDIIRIKQDETKKQMAEFENETRKTMKKLGFNVLILPKDQNLEDLYAKDYASKYMPEDYARQLVDSKIIMIQHLLPGLRQKIEWTEQQGRVVVLVGVRGEVSSLHRDPNELMLQPVPPGSLVVGYQLHTSLGLKTGDRVKLLGTEFTVAKLHEERGDKDDITLWANLAECQRLLKKPGMINEILALKCQCAGVGMEKVRSEIARILPDTQAIELATKALTRAEARETAAALAQRAIEAERDGRARLRAERERFAAWLVPLVTLACTVWIGFLALSNVRERLPEIGILRALGLRSSDVFALFLGKAILIGAIGAIAGYAAGLAVSAAWSDVPRHAQAAARLSDPGLLAAVLVLAPLLSALATLVPALRAAQQDPAVALRES